MTGAAEQLFMIRVYGDSLAMPRAEAGVTCDQTYAELFAEWCRKRHPASSVKLYNRSAGAADVPKLSDLFATGDSIFT